MSFSNGGGDGDGGVVVLVLLKNTQVEHLKAALVARDSQLDQVFLYDPSIKCFLLFEYGCKYIKDGRNFHILNIEQVGRRLSLVEVERAQLVSLLDLDCNDDHTSG